VGYTVGMSTINPLTSLQATALPPLKTQPKAPEGPSAPADTFKPGVATHPTPGAAGGGDSLFPNMGNGGYDAKHYDVKLDVDVAKNNFNSAEVTMSANATQDLSSLDMDFRGFNISKIMVNGEEAKYTRHDQELIITPKDAIAANDPFKVSVAYSGAPKQYQSDAAPVPLGWGGFNHGKGHIGTDVVDEPDGAPSWMPVNDLPSDKASYNFDITVDKPYTAVANGILQSVEDKGSKQTFHWQANDPMASYLATVHTGNYVADKQTGPNGLPIVHYFPADIADKCKFDFGRTPEMVDYFSKIYGPYPFQTYGAIVMDTQIGGAALETQTRPLFERGMITGDRSNENIYAHELAHQWRGDDCTVKQWKDVWLNEGFATYSEWLWKEHTDGPAALEQEVKDSYSSLQGWGGAVNLAAPPPAGIASVGSFQTGFKSTEKGIAPHDTHTDGIADPTAEQLFSNRIYQQGALTLQALRKNVGDDTFFKIVRTFTDDYKGKSAGTDDFVSVASQVAGKDLKPLFDQWLHSGKLPPSPA
jgi:aminopeptidase N